ncbi:hypothetical protein GCM10018965_081840 [Nonomuraea roseola]
MLAAGGTGGRVELDADLARFIGERADRTDRAVAATRRRVQRVGTGSHPPPRTSADAGAIPLLSPLGKFLSV